MNRSARLLACGVLGLSMPGCGSGGDETESGGIEENVGSSSSADEGDPKLDLDGIPAASLPLALTQYLQHVVRAVADEVGPDLYVGSQIDLPDSPDVAVTIFGTDVQRLSDALDRIAIQERDRFSVTASEYSRSELERFATDADAWLADAGIEATAGVGMGHIDVLVVTPDGSPDPELERAARAILGDLPFDIEFTSPPVSLGS